MRSQAFAAFMKFTRMNEGVTSWPYPDVLGYVTTGMGNLIDGGQKNDTYTLPWQHKAPGDPDSAAFGPYGPYTGGAASRDEIDAAWNAVKANPGRGSGYAYQNMTDLRIDDAAISNLVAKKLSANESVLRGYFPMYDSLGADAQTALHAMAWAMGPDFPQKFPTFRAAVNARDFQTAADESHCANCTDKRNDAMIAFLTSAKTALAQGSDPNALLSTIDANGNVTAGTMPQNLDTSDPEYLAGGVATLTTRTFLLLAAVGGSYFLLKKAGFFA